MIKADARMARAIPADFSIKGMSTASVKSIVQTRTALCCPKNEVALEIRYIGFDEIPAIQVFTPQHRSAVSTIILSNKDRSREERTG